MESLVDRLRSTYSGKRIVVTGHNGFKGSWLVGLLNYLGADVDGISLPINSYSPFRDFHLKGPHRSHEIDIRDLASLSRLIGNLQPELVFHLAAQSLVLNSYVDPRETFETNVMGTANLLHSLSPGTYRGIITTTTDKVYMNDESGTKFKESDVLWGHDPYSLSKTGTELVVSAWRNLDMESKTKYVTVRAGNVIGAGDFSENRLLPDLLRGISQNHLVEIRNPESIRPWQYVLDPLVGYLLIGNKIFSGGRINNAYNFGPPDESFVSVLEFGAGTGVLAEIWESDYGITPTCVEIAPSLQKILISKGFKTLDNIAKLSQDQGFIYTSNVLEHIEDDLGALIQIRSHLEIEGKLAIYVPALPFLFSDLDRRVGHFRRYRKSELINKVESAGFRIEYCHYNDCLGVLASLALKIIGYKNKAGLGSKKSLIFYDNVVYPISIILDKIVFKFLIGKNLLLIATNPKS